MSRAHSKSTLRLTIVSGHEDESPGPRVEDIISEGAGAAGASARGRRKAERRRPVSGVPRARRSCGTGRNATPSPWPPTRRGSRGDEAAPPPRRPAAGETPRGRRVAAGRTAPWGGRGKRLVATATCWGGGRHVAGAAAAPSGEPGPHRRWTRGHAAAPLPSRCHAGETGGGRRTAAATVAPLGGTRGRRRAPPERAEEGCGAAAETQREPQGRRPH